MKNHIPTFEDFVNEQTLADRNNEYPVNDWGYELMEEKIKKHLNVNADQIEELEDLPGFIEGELSTYSTAAEGNFVLNCGRVEDTPACRSLDELNNITLYYIPKK
jgi:hypothetical protein